MQQRQSLLDLEARGAARACRRWRRWRRSPSSPTRTWCSPTTQLKLEEERYAAGAGTSLEVRNAQLKLTQAQLTQVQGRVDVEIARAALRAQRRRRRWREMP